MEKSLENFQNILSTVRTVLDATPDAILLVSQEGDLITYNKTFAKMWSMPAAAELQGQNIFTLDLFKDKSPALRDFLNEFQNTYDKEHSTHDVLELIDGRVIERFSNPHRMEGKIVGRVFSFRDITTFKEAEEQLAYLAYHDALTGLPNRRLLADRLNVAFAHAKRHKTHTVLMFLDLDRFKIINDSLGHAIGDQVLIETAQRLKQSLREEDTIARLGGDEFVLFLPHVECLENIQIVSQRLCEVLRHPITVGKKEFKVSASIGIALYPLDASNLEDLLNRADEALYRAKAKGGNCFVFFQDHPDLLQNIEEQESLHERHSFK